MKELTTEELLKCLSEWFDTVYDYGNKRDQEAYQQIRRLIEEKPKVTRGFVERWSKTLAFLPISQDVKNWTIEMPKQIEQMLIEAGAEVEE